MKLDTIRTLLWVNAQRLKKGRPPRLWMPANKWGPGTRRADTCPVARALPGDVVAWNEGYYRRPNHKVIYEIPAYVSRYVNDSDRELNK